MERPAVQRGCPRCWVPMPALVLAQPGLAHCGSCALDFTAVVFEPVAPKAFQPPDAAAVAAAQCARHPRNAALGACDRCGAFICSLCRVDHAGEQICTRCFERPDTAQAGTFRSWRSISHGLALAGIVCFPLGLLVGPAAIAATVAARRQARAHGDPVRPLDGALVSLAGALETALSLLFLASVLSK